MSDVSTTQHFFDAYNAHNVERMLSLCTRDAQLRHVPMGRLETGSIYSVGRKAWSDIFSALPDLRVKVSALISDGTNAGVEAVISDNARGFAVPQAYFLAFDAMHRITHITVYWDNVTLGFQLTKAGAENLVHGISQLRKL